MFKKILDHFFGWELIYSTQSVEDYAKFKGKLMNAGVKYKSRFINHGDRHRGGLYHFITYEIFVKTDDLHKINKVNPK